MRAASYSSSSSPSSSSSSSSSSVNDSIDHAASSVTHRVDDHNEVEDDYDLDSRSSNVREEIADPESRSHVIKKLEEWTTYRITVAAATIIGPGPPSPDLLVRTDEFGMFFVFLLLFLALRYVLFRLHVLSSSVLSSHQVSPVCNFGVSIRRFFSEVLQTASHRSPAYHHLSRLLLIAVCPYITLI